MRISDWSSNVCSSVLTALPYVESGRIKALGVTTRQRAAVLPDIQTFEEQGISDYDATLWFGVFAPAGVGPAIAQQLSDALQTIFARDDVKQDIAKRGRDRKSGGSGKSVDVRVK